MAKMKMTAARAARVRESVTRAVECDLCPEITPEKGMQILMERRTAWIPSVTEEQRAISMSLLDDPEWCARMLGWINDYWQEHGHGPTWRAFLGEPSLWPDESEPRARAMVLPILSQRGQIDGTRTPFSLRAVKAELDKESIAA